MTHEHDRLEQELAALRPVEPSAELAERIGAQLAVKAEAPVRKDVGAWHLPETFWMAPLGVLAAAVLIGVVWWSVRDNRQEERMPLEVAQPTLAAALDESLPSVWTFRPALESTSALDHLLDQHAARRNAAGDPVQTRGFVPVTMNLNSRLGEL